MFKIILIEDDDETRKLYRSFLEKEGFTVVEAINGAEGLDIFENGQPKLLITDIIMDEKDGLEVIKEILGHHPDFPIIAISGGGMGAPGPYLSAAQHLGVKTILTKPISPVELITSVRDCLANPL